jgi:hypothetical protein
MYQNVESYLISFPRYQCSRASANLIFQTDPIIFTQYGIPQFGAFYRTDRDRSFMKIPHDPNQEPCIQLFKMLKEIDDHMVKNRGELFGSLSSKYEYVPIVKKDEYDDQEDSKIYNKAYSNLAYCR